MNIFILNYNSFLIFDLMPFSYLHFALLVE